MTNQRIGKSDSALPVAQVLLVLPDGGGGDNFIHRGLIESGLTPAAPWKLEVRERKFKSVAWQRRGAGAANDAVIGIPTVLGKDETRPLITLPARSTCFSGLAVVGRVNMESGHDPGIEIVAGGRLEEKERDRKREKGASAIEELTHLHHDST